MTVADRIRRMSDEELAEYSLTLIIETENNILDKLAVCGLEVDIVRLDVNIRLATLLRDLQKEDVYGSDT